MITKTDHIPGLPGQGSVDGTGPGSVRRIFGFTSRLPMRLMLALAVTGAALPVIQASWQAEPWLASVTLGLQTRDAATAAPTFDVALREIRTTKTLGRAVDLLGLDRDPEFSGTASTALGVALELLTGENSGPADARRRAIKHLQEKIALSRKPGTVNAELLVKASSPEKAMKIAEAIATVYAAGSEATASIPAGRTAAQEKLEKAEAALADFTAKAGADHLSAALVLKSRMDGLDSHIAELSASGPENDDRLAKASLKDVLDGRLPIATADADLDRLRQAYINARLAADALAMSLGPKHPKLLAAQSEAETARQALADQFGRVKKRLAHAAEEKANGLKALHASREDLARQIAAMGVDLAQYQKLSTAVDDVRKDYDAAGQASSSGKETVFEASVPQPIDAPVEGLAGWQVALGALAGAALGLTYAAWRHFGRAGSAAPPEMEPVEARIEPVIVPPVIKPSAEEPKAMGEISVRTEDFLDPGVASAPQAAERNSIELQLAAIRARRRNHQAANAADVIADMPAEPVVMEPPAYRSRLGLDRVHPEDLPLIEKLRQVAPQVFADPAEEAEIERLRQELADLRNRVLARVGAA